LWWKMIVESRDDMYGIDSAILMNPKVWDASGHTSAGFEDPLVEDYKTHKRFRADHLLEENGIERPETLTHEQMNTVIKEKGIKSPDGNELSEVRGFNMMFKTQIGATADPDSISYLRPENAQGMFVNFKNILDSFYPDLPFGIAQVGRNFRNEISPREFIFRVRELEIMELEYFIKGDEWERHFEHWKQQFYEYIKAIGLKAEKVHELDVPDEDRAHYSKKTIDFEYEFPFGIKEIGAVAYRTDFDLSNHQKHSGVNMEYTVKGSNEKFIPHVIEPTFGLTRLVLAVMAESYREDEQNGEKRVFLALPANIAPVKVAVAPLLKNKPELVGKAKEVYGMLKKEIGAVMWDDNGNIGKRYRRQDEIGTPYFVVIDFDTLEDGTVTIRDRDTTEQVRVKIEELLSKLAV
jgi:glycyl-tRNA synthetase